MEKSRKTIVYVISDSLGETAEQVARAAVTQFVATPIGIKRISYVNNKGIVDSIINESINYNSILLFTIVIPEIREYLILKATEFNVDYIDILSPVISMVKQKANSEPTCTPGMLRRLDKEYFKKVEAIEFAVKYDDGKDARGIHQADVILVGISRTSKTPLSMYLASKNIKVINIPLVPEINPPSELFQGLPGKIIGLTNSPSKLYEIRLERLNALGLHHEGNYASLERIMEEINYGEEIMKNLGCPIIDVTSKAIEETAGIIIEILRGGN